MRTIAIVALKGGSGKTTIAAHLALAAHLRGQAVMVADIDPQRSTSQVLSAREIEGPEVTVASGATLLATQFAAASLNKQLLIVDTAAGALEDVSEALVLADMAVMVVRPTLLDIAALARTFAIVRRLQKPYLVVVNQAPVARGGIEPPVVKRALRALDYMQLKIAGVIVRARSVYQTALETGRSAEEAPDKAAAAEIAALWDEVAAELSAATAAARA